MSLIAVFIATIGYAVVVRVPRGALLGAGAAGMLAWGAAWLLGGNTALAAFGGAVVAGVCGEILARLSKMPATVYSSSGVISLVPGLSAYQAALAFAKGQYLGGIGLAVHVLSVAVSIAGGLAVVVVVTRFLLEQGKKNAKKAAH